MRRADQAEEIIIIIIWTIFFDFYYSAHPTAAAYKLFLIQLELYLLLQGIYVAVSLSLSLAFVGEMSLLTF